MYNIHSFDNGLHALLTWHYTTRIVQVMQLLKTKITAWLVEGRHLWLVHMLGHVPAESTLYVEQRGTRSFIITIWQPYGSASGVRSLNGNPHSMLSRINEVTVSGTSIIFNFIFHMTPRYATLIAKMYIQVCRRCRLCVPRQPQSIIPLPCATSQGNAPVTWSVGWRHQWHQNQSQFVNGYITAQSRTCTYCMLQVKLKISRCHTRT